MNAVTAAAGRAVDDERMRWRGIAAWVVALVVVATWFVAFRPQGLGGSAAYVGVRGGSMSPTMRDGDLAVVRKSAQYRPGDVIAYRIPSGQPEGGLRIIHRIVGGDARVGFIMKGDHIAGVDVAHPKPQNIVGKVWFRVPGAARFFAKLPGPAWMAFVVGVTSFLLLALPGRKRRAALARTTVA